MKTADKEKLWDAYRQKKTQETREQLIIEYAQLVKLVAGRLSMYLGHNVEYDDLVSYGIFGLIDAIDKFDLEKNVKFETYASLRIRGAILDQIRKMDWIPRSVRQRQRKIDEAMKQIEMRTGKTASDEELAKQLGLTEEELCNWQTQLKVTNVVSLNEFEENGPDSLAGMMASILQGSTDTTFYVITLYYSSVGISKITNSLSIGLFADFAGISMAILLALYFFK